MENNLSSVKCAQCSLVNFPVARVCKRCGTPLSKPEVEVEHPGPLPRRTQLIRAQLRHFSGQSASLKRIASVVALVILLSLVFKPPRQAVQTVSPVAEGIATAQLRAEFVANIKPTTDKLADDLFIQARNEEYERIHNEFEEKDGAALDRGEKVQAALKAKQETDEVSKLTPAHVAMVLEGPDSDILVYRVTGDLSEMISRRMVDWWLSGSAAQRENLRQLGFKAVVIADATLEGQRFNL